MAKMYTIALALVILSFMAVQAGARAGAVITSANTLAYNTQFHVFLAQYLSPTTISSSVYYNQSIGNDTYVIMQLSKVQNTYVIVNTTNNAYSFVLDNSTAYSLLRPLILVRYYPNSTVLNSLNALMLSFQQTAAPPLADCLVETGLNTGLTCTLANGCASCQIVPVCRKFLAATSNYATSNSTASLPVGSNLAVVSISNFSVAYSNLNSSYNSYFSLLSKINQSNAHSTFQLLHTSVNRLSNISTNLPHNPLFPVPQGFNPSNFSACTSYVTTQAPWYCNAVGYCRATSFNSTKLYLISATLTNLAALPLSNTSQHAISENATLKAFSLLEPSLQTSLTAIIDANYGMYNATTANSTALLGVYYNASLLNATTALQGTFTKLVGYDFHINASTYNATLASQFASLSLIYIPLNAQHNTLEAITTNNTALVLQRELEYQSEPSSLASLAYSQQSLNDLLVSGINSSQYAAIYAQLKTVQSGLNAIGAPTSMPAFIKKVDGGFVGSILGGSNAPVPDKLSAAPLYVFLLTLAISIVVILAIYFGTYHHLKRRNRLRLHAAAKRAWLILFIVLFVVGVAFSYLTSTYAAQANTFLPVDGFIAQIASHNTVFIAFNTNATAANQSIRQCAATINDTLSDLNKTVDAIVIQNYTCIGSNPYCFDQILASGQPVIVLTQSPVSYVTYKGMYGQTLYAGGEAASGSQCYLNGILNVK